MTKLIVAVAVIVLLVGAAAVFVVSRVHERIHQPFQGYETQDQLVEIPSGAGSSAIGRRLVEAGVVRDELTFRAALRLSGNARRLQAGEYRFDRPLSAVEVVEKIVRGDVDLVNLTFREGLTIDEMSEVFEAAGFGQAATFVEAAANVALISDVDAEAEDLEGYLFPDTYALPRRTDASQMIQVMIDRFKEVLTPELQRAAIERALSVRELVTLASLVEKETARADERTVVAAVYHNRLRIGMGLQCDPTVIYALQRAGQWDGNLRRVDLTFDSPYNTYRYPGLPPGPIAAPGRGSLLAAANPSDDDYLYFVSRNDGSHAFARTLAEHNRNVQRFQVQFFRDQRRAARERAAAAGGR
jgi:UPF0755 protein